MAQPSQSLEGRTLPDVSVILPARNEAATIAAVIHRLANALNERGWSHEIILGDSASTDGTVSAARASGHPVRVVSESLPGKGRILTRAFMAARGLTLAFMDSDLDLDPEDLPTLIDVVHGGVDCAAAAKRDIRGIARPLVRRVGSRVVNMAARSILRTGLMDHQTGMKAFGGPALRAVLPEVREEGWLWDTEVLWRLQRAGGMILQVPITMGSGRPSGVPRIQYGLGDARQIVGFYGRLVHERWTARDALTPGVVGLSRH